MHCLSNCWLFLGTAKRLWKKSWNCPTDYKATGTYEVVLGYQSKNNWLKAGKLYPIKKESWYISYQPWLKGPGEQADHDPATQQQCAAKAVNSILGYSRSVAAAGQGWRLFPSVQPCWDTSAGLWLELGLELGSLALSHRFWPLYRLGWSYFSQ